MLRDALVRARQDATRIRNVCVLAHVDHGKTSTTDSLIAHNGHISQKLAGKVPGCDSCELGRSAPAAGRCCVFGAATVYGQPGGRTVARHYDEDQLYRANVRELLLRVNSDLKRIRIAGTSLKVQRPPPTGT